MHLAYLSVKTTLVTGLGISRVLGGDDDTIEDSMVADCTNLTCKAGECTNLA